MEAKNKLARENYVYQSNVKFDENFLSKNNECPYIVPSTGVLVECTPEVRAEASMTEIPVTEVPVIVVTPDPVEEDGINDFTTMKFSEYIYTMKLSFYDPNIGFYFPEVASVNCGDWDYARRVCNGRVLLNQQRYEDWYGRGVACPIALPDLTVIEVLSPEPLVGYWICVDRGGAIVDNWLDFMLHYPDQVWTGVNLDNFPWGSEVLIRVAE